MRYAGFYVILIVLLVCCTFFVSGLGVSPASINLVYDKSVGIDESFDLRIVTSSPNTKFVDIALTEYNTPFGLPDGTVLFNSSQLSEYVILSDDFIDIHKRNTVNIKVKIPPNAPVYGPNCFGISMRERSDESSGFFAVTTAVLLKVSIDASYPGQYLDITKFKIDNVNEGESSNLYWQVKGRGEQDTPFSAALEIISEEKESVFKRDLGSKSVKRMEVYPPDSFYESLPTNTFTPGIYEGILTVKFLNNIKKSSIKFNVGYEAVYLDNYTPKTLIYGDINEIKLIVRNLWNGQFNNVYGVIEIFGENISEVKATTPSGILTPFGNLEMRQFIDVRNLPEGKYGARITIHFDNLSNEFPAEFMIAKEVVAPVVEEEKGISSKTYLIIGISLGIVLLLIFVFIWISHRNKTKETPQAQQPKTKK